MNGELGKSVTKFLLSDPEVKIELVVVNCREKRSESFLAEIEALRDEYESEFLIFEWDVNALRRYAETFKKCNFGVSALFGHLIPESIISDLGGKVLNLHPSLLPFGKGADPVPWAIILQEKQGATIHQLTKDLDGGAVLSQEEIVTEIGMNSGEVYELCVNSLFNQFKKIFQSWLDEHMIPLPQNSNKFSARKSYELESLRILDCSEVSTCSSLIRRLQALTYSDGRLPIYRDESGSLWDINIKLNKRI